jgi:hypothetical protein
MKRLLFTLLVFLVFISCENDENDITTSKIMGEWEIILNNTLEKSSLHAATIILDANGEIVAAIDTLITGSFKIVNDTIIGSIQTIGENGDGNIITDKYFISGIFKSDSILNLQGIHNWSSSKGSQGTDMVKFNLQKTKDETRLKENPEMKVALTADAFCIRFNNTNYYVEATIKDPNNIVSYVSISGDYVENSSPLTRNLYSNKPGQWWTDPNIFISSGSTPLFPLNYTIHINFKNSTIVNMPKCIESWENAE